jgi:protein O-GlcNAc transferase
MSGNDRREDLRTAVALHQAGRLDNAAKMYRQVLGSDPDNALALHYLGVVEASLGNLERAKSLMARSLEMRPLNIPFLENYATILSQSGDYESALAICRQGLQASGNNASLLYVSAVSLYKLNRLEESVAQFDKLLVIQPYHIAAMNERGTVLADLNKHEAALASCQNVLALQPDYAEGQLNVGNIYAKLRRYEEALAAYDKALTLKPDLADACLGRGNVLVRLRRYGEASAALDRALNIRPDLAQAWLGRGNVFAGLKRFDHALAAFDKALGLNPDLAEAWLGRGNILTALKQYDDALAALNKALTLKPDLGEAWVGRGNLFAALRRYDDCLADLDKAVMLNADLPSAWTARGGILTLLRRYDQAFAALDKALALEPDAPYVEGGRLLTKMHVCDWTGFDEDCAHLRSSIEKAIPQSPFVALTIPSSAREQLQCARLFATSEYPPPHEQTRRKERYGHERIRVAYLSGDFGEHAVFSLLVGAIERHDRSRFETFAISFGPRNPEEISSRLKEAFSRFIDVRDRSDADVAKLLRKLEIDIAVDLMGYTVNFRAGIFARRPAAVQVNYLGYPGTSGADYMDYIVADPTIIPREHFEFYREKVLWLPNSYQPNDNTREISGYTPDRRECGLPDTGFVFCCFNNSYKLNPEIFRIWMRLLKALPGSVLWLSGHDAIASANLCRAAETNGVSSDRLVFAARVPSVADHLARLRQADLFLDTLPYNAHATASDALWAGLPVVTCLGSTFPGRVAASLLKGAGLEELITLSLDDYEALALRLARDTGLLASLRTKLAQNRDTCPLFDTRQFTVHLEAAYAAAHERAEAGLAPDHILSLSTAAAR